MLKYLRGNHSQANRQEEQTHKERAQANNEEIKKPQFQHFWRRPGYRGFYKLKTDLKITKWKCEPI